MKLTWLNLSKSQFSLMRTNREYTKITNVEILVLVTSSLVRINQEYKNVNTEILA